jgi:uncharacterized protein DUF4304
MPSPSALSKVVRLVGPDMRTAGFRRFGVTFNREVEPGLIHVVGFQGSQWGGKFTVNLGVYVREIDLMFDDWWHRQGKPGEPGRDGAVREEVCWLRVRLGRLAAEGDREDKWWGYEDPDSVAADIRRRLQQDAEPAFTHANSRAALISHWDRRQSTAGGGSDWPWRIERRAPLGYAVLLKSVGRANDAQRIIDEVLASSAGTPFHSVVEVFAEDLGLASAD